MNIIFYNGTHWLGFIAPEKPSTPIGISPKAWVNYNIAYAEAKRRALPILNPDILSPLQDGNRNYILLPRQRVPTLVKYEMYTSSHDGRIHTGFASEQVEDYIWPGDMLVDKCWAPSGYVLSLPNSAKNKMVKKSYWLADGKDIDQYGTIWKVDLLDGPHSSPEGPVKAKKIIEGIGLDRGLNRNYVMVTVEIVPDLEVKVNEEAIKLNKMALNHAKRIKK